MERNPYEALAALIPPGGGPPAFRRGKVLTVTPLKVEVAGTQQSGNIYINPALLRGQKKKTSAQGSLVLTYTGGPISGTATGELTLTAEEDGLKAGDDVLLLSEADQTFILICRLVKA